MYCLASWIPERGSNLFKKDNFDEQMRLNNMGLDFQTYLFQCAKIQNFQYPNLYCISIYCKKFEIDINLYRI